MNDRRRTLEIYLQNLCNDESMCTPEFRQFLCQENFLPEQWKDEDIDKPVLDRLINMSFGAVKRALFSNPFDSLRHRLSRDNFNTLEIPTAKQEEDREDVFDASHIHRHPRVQITT